MDWNAWRRFFRFWRALMWSSLPSSLIFYAFGKPVAVPSSSGFCQKLETFLRVCDVKYETRGAVSASSAPKGRLPYVVLPPGVKGNTAHADTIVPDSHFIIRHLIATGAARDLNAGLTPAQLADMRAYQGLWEERVYPCIIYERWFEDQNFATISSEIVAASGMPWIFGSVVFWMVRRGICAQLDSRGISRYTRDQIYSFVIDAVADLEARYASAAATVDTATTPVFFFGTLQPTEIDVIVYGFAASAFSTKSNPVFMERLLASPTLMRLVQHMTATYFPEYTQMLEAILAAVSAQ